METFPARRQWFSTAHGLAVTIFCLLHGRAASLENQFTIQYIAFAPEPSSAPTSSAQPSILPSYSPTYSQSPSSVPSILPSHSMPPSMVPSRQPTLVPSQVPSYSQRPSSVPSNTPTASVEPSSIPSVLPSLSTSPSGQPSNLASSQPTMLASNQPSFLPSASPEASPSSNPSHTPSLMPSQPSEFPSLAPTQQVFGILSPVENKDSLSASPSQFGAPTVPTVRGGGIDALSASPSHAPTITSPPSSIPSDLPSLTPSVVPTAIASSSPSSASELNNTSTNSGPDSNAATETNSTMEKYYMVTAVSSIVLQNQNSTLDLQRKAIFESIAMGFLTHHYTHAINNEGIEFTEVTIIDQVPKTYPAQRKMQEESELGLVDDAEAARSLPFAIDIEIVFEVAGIIQPDDNFVFMDFQWLVETLFDVNLDDFYERLDKTGEFKPISIQEETTSSIESSESEVSSGSQFNIWMIASIGAVVLSVFLTAVLITGATRRARRQRLETSLSNSQVYGSSSSPLDNDFSRSRRSPAEQSAFSTGYEDESLDGLKLVRSDSKSAVSTLGASIKRNNGSIFLPNEETESILRQLSIDEQEKDRGLNARMRKRLIEREIKAHGFHAGLSMEAILHATSSFHSEEEDERHRGLTISVSADGTENPSPVAVPQGNRDFPQANAPKANGIFSTWFGRKAGYKVQDEEREERVNIPSPYRLRKSKRVPLPSKAEVITIGESIREEYPLPTPNWTSSTPQGDKEQNERVTRSPFKALGNAALRAIGRGEKNEPSKIVQLSDEYDVAADENVRRGDLSALRGLGAIRSSKHGQRVKSSTPVWLANDTDNAMGFVNVRSGDTPGAESRRSSLSSFPISPRRFSVVPPRKQSVGDSTAASSWKRPGRIKTEFQSSPLQRRLARARSDPPIRRTKPPLKLQVPEDAHYNNAQGYPEDHMQQESRAFTAVDTHRPHSKVHLIKKGSKLSKVERRRVPNRVEEYTTSAGGRIGAAPMVEMNVSSNKDAMILGSAEENGLELEWGMTI